MRCEAALEQMVEACRKRAEPEPVLRAHLDECHACAERWREQRSLSAGLRVMRIRAAGQRSPDALRSTLLREFAERNPAAAQKGFGRRWLWSVAAAAVFVLGAFVVQDVVKKPAPVPAGIAVADTAYDEPDPREEGFIEVPFAPPLAEGEMVRVVHTELQPAALASMGVNVDPSWTTELPADLLVGQDGFPRAVRVSDESTSESGS